MTRGQSGFTLLEILVALVVLGFLMLGLTQGIGFGLRMWDVQARTIGSREDLDAVDRALRRLIEQIDSGSSDEPIGVEGSARSLAFISELPVMAAEMPTRRANVALGVAADHRLILRWTPHLHAVRFGLLQEAQELELLRGVERLELAYWGAVPGSSGWHNSWKQAVSPTLIRLRLVFVKGDRRHWPDIIAAPMRDRSED